MYILKIFLKFGTFRVMFVTFEGKKFLSLIVSIGTFIVFSCDKIYCLGLLKQRSTFDSLWLLFKLNSKIDNAKSWLHLHLVMAY